MVVFSAFMLVIVVAFFIPRKHLKIYFVFLSFILGGLYFFFYPSEDYDLYRHYEMAEILKDFSFNDVIIPNSGIVTSNYILNRYLRGNRVFVVYSYIISRSNIEHLLPVITGFIVLFLITRRIWKESENYRYSKGTILSGLVFFLFLFDYRSISSIRNVFAFAVFTYVLYQDVVRGKNRIWCFLAYLLLCQIHSVIYIFVALRCLLLITNRYTKIAIGLMVFMSYALNGQIVSLLSHISEFKFVTEFIGRIISYSGGGTDFSLKRGIFRGGVMLVYLLIYFSGSKDLNTKKGMRDYGYFFVLTFLFTAGSMTQYDIFIRNDMILLMLLMPYYLRFAEDYFSFRNCRIVIRSVAVKNYSFRLIPVIVSGTVICICFL